MLSQQQTDQVKSGPSVFGDEGKSFGKPTASSGQNVETGTGSCQPPPAEQSPLGLAEPCFQHLGSGVEDSSYWGCCTFQREKGSCELEL